MSDFGHLFAPDIATANVANPKNARGCDTRECAAPFAACPISDIDPRVTRRPLAIRMRDVINHERVLGRAQLFAVPQL